MEESHNADLVRVAMTFDVPIAACESFFLDVAEAARRNGATLPDASGGVMTQPKSACDCEDHAHVKDAYFERNCAYCGCRKGTGKEPSVYEVERHNNR